MTFSRPQTQKIFVFPQSVQFRDAGNFLGLWVFFFLCIGLGFLVEFVIGALGKILGSRVRFLLQWAVL
jgi:hypothetical protein